MATVIKRGKLLHISYYNFETGKVTTKSLGLEATEANYKKAKKIADKFQEELSSSRKKMKEMGIKKITIKDAFEHFLNINKNKHKKTIYEYHNFYKHFTNYFDENQACIIINKISAEEWLMKIKELPFQENTIHTIGKQFQHFLGFLFEYNYIPMFMINRAVKTKPVIKEKIIFTEEAITEIFNGLEDKNINFRTLIFLAFYSGLRSSDLISIKAEKIDINSMTLRYYSPKGKLHREVPLHDDLKAILSERLKEIPSGKLISYSSTENLGKAVKRYFDKLKLDNLYSARTFRKTFITLARAYGIDDSVVRELVGHSHQSTADRHYNKIQLETMRKELQKFKRPGAAI